MNSSMLKLSKFIGYILRHKPEEYNLSPDSQGWVPLEKLISVLRTEDTEWENLTIEDMFEFIERQEKKRYEIEGGLIRAIYGHSTEKKIKHEASQPPDVLYHGTTPEAINSIMENGLQPMKRQYVHLSPNLEVAENVAKRYCNNPIILTVLAKEAYEKGVCFYHANEKVWLCDAVEPIYLKKS